MRIALISYEYPLDTAVGGIATYVGQAARMLSARGHDVHVFAGSQLREGEVIESGGPSVHLVRVSTRPEFSAKAGVRFAEVHSNQRFDVLEGPDFGAEASHATALVPEIPLVLKLHMGFHLIRTIEASTYSTFTRLRHRLGAWRRRITTSWDASHPDHAQERLHAAQADEIAAPCKAISEEMVKLWRLDSSLTSIYPYPYNPPPELLSISPDTSGSAVTFVGRLEVRKGVVDLVDAIPNVLRSCPTARFRFVGRPLPSPIHGLNMREFLIRRLGRAAESVTFDEPVPVDQIAKIYSESRICVFPSIWENFPNVCLEAMAAARPIVATDAGGMPEQLDGGRVGLLVRPRDPKGLSTAIIKLLTNDKLRLELGHGSRLRLLSAFAPSIVAPLHEQSYTRAISRRSSLGSRATSLQ